MFLVQARGALSSMSVGTACASSALLKLDEMIENGARDVVVLDVAGAPLTREDLQSLSDDHGSSGRTSQAS